MKVIHVLNELRASGAEVMLRQAAPIWQTYGLSCDVVATAEQVGDYASALAEAGYRIHHVPFSPSIAHLRALRRLLSDQRYDVVHLHSERATFWHALVALSTGSCVVRSVHSVFDFRGLVRAERWGQRALLRALGVNTMSVSASVQSHEQRHFRNPTVHVANWIDTDRFQPTASDERRAARRALGVEQRMVVTSIGNCAPAKNHETILRALAELKSGWCYLHVGEEEPALVERRLSRQLGIDDACRWLDRVDDVRPVLAATDVFVMPSLYEGMGIAALEAVATGVRCVLADSPGLGDLRTLVEGPIVWIEPTPAALHTALCAAFAQPQPGEAQRQAMNRSVEKNFGINRGARAYVDVYRSTIGNRWVSRLVK